jgi:hypothetical protein
MYYYRLESSQSSGLTAAADDDYSLAEDQISSGSSIQYSDSNRPGILSDKLKHIKLGLLASTLLNKPDVIPLRTNQAKRRKNIGFKERVCIYYNTLQGIGSFNIHSDKSSSVARLSIF